MSGNTGTGFREAKFKTDFTALIKDEKYEGALTYLIDEMPKLLASGMNRKEKLNHLIFASRLIQQGGDTKHGTTKLLRKAATVVGNVDINALKEKRLFIDFGAGAHDPIALAVYFYLNGFEEALANDMLPPRNQVYSAMSMRDILADMAADPKLFLLPKASLSLFRKRLGEFDLQAFGAGKFEEGFAGTEGRVRYVVDDIVNANIPANSVSLIVSFAVFEHVMDMKGVLDFLYSRTAPGGQGFHFIDMADHRSYRHDGAFNQFSFLTEKEGPSNINRLRKSEQIAAFEAAGFEINREYGKTNEVPAETRAAYLPRWAKMSDEDQTTINVTLSIKKPDDGKKARKSKRTRPTATKVAAKPAKASKKPATTAKKSSSNPADAKPATVKPKGIASMRKSELGELKEFRVELPENLRTHPSMMSQIEREVLYGLARDSYKGDGLIIDAGVFLGASTRLLGHGIKANPKGKKILAKTKKPIVTFEHGQLGGGMPGFFERHGVETEGLIKGKSFEPLLKKMIKDVRPMIELRIGDILTQPWGDKNIEICFLDVIKSYEINQFVLKEFFPKLIPGKSILIQQDYFIDRLPFLKMSQELLSPFFEYLGNAQSSGYFRLKKKITKKAIGEAAKVNELPLDRKFELIEQCADRVSFDEDRMYLVLLSKVIAANDTEGNNAGIECWNELKKRLPDQANLETQSRNRIKLAHNQLNKDLKIS